MSYKILFETQIQELYNYMEDRLPNNHIELAFTDEYGFDNWWEEFGDTIFNQSDEILLHTNEEVRDWIGENFFEKWMVLVEKVREEEESFFGEDEEMYQQYGQVLTDPHEMYITFRNKFVYWVGMELVRDRYGELEEKLKKAALTLQKHWKECRYNPEYSMFKKIFTEGIESIERPNLPNLPNQTYH